MNLIEAVQQRANQFEKLLNARLWLFNIDGTYIELPTPQMSRKDGKCTIYIPERGERLRLVDNLGTIRGSLVYEVANNDLILKQYSFGFEHNHTYIQLHEDRAGDKSRYGFHYDMDRDNEKAIIHPLQHLQFSSLDVPRFEMPANDNEVVVFEQFLELIKQTFYTNNATPPQKPKLECAQIYLSAYH